MTTNNSQNVEQDKYWKIKSGNVPKDDPLLGCLVVITRLEGKPYSAESLSAGIPLVDNKLTPELFLRAAKRAELSAEIVKRDLKDISPLVLPAVLLLKNMQACLLVDIKKNGKIAQIIQPETGEGARSVKMSQLEKLYTGHCIFTKPSYKFEQRTKENILVKDKGWFTSVLKKVWKFYIEVIVATFLINIFAVLSPLFTMNVYDKVVPNSAMDTLTVLAIGMIVVYCFDFLMKTLRGYFIDVAGKKADILLTSAIYEQMIGVKMKSRPESVGAFANNMNQFDSFREFITSATITTVIDLPFVVFFIFIIFSVGGNLGFVSLVALPVVVIAGLIIQQPLDRLVKESYRFASQKQAMLIESLMGVETIKSSSAESPMQRRWEHLAGMSSKHSIKIKILTQLAVNFSQYSQQIAGIIIIILGVNNISSGDMTMGALIACNMLNSRAMAPLGQVASLLTKYHQSMTAFKSVDNLMKMENERPLGKTPLHKSVLNGDIEFKNVTFSYPNQEGKALENVSLKIKSGEKVGIIGRIGSGKSTFEKLILNLYEPTDGSVLLDGLEAKQLDPASIRKNIGYVPQDLTLFYGSVKDNIVLGAPYAEDQSILQAASISGVNEFIASHPKGFDLQVGERGDKLSGGQRQSVVIARSLLLDPPILVFDEPTNMMDSRSEEMFKLKLSQIIQDKTLVLVTHKGSLLALVDRLILIEGGKIIADGPKADVLKALNEGKLERAD